jgi:predicted transposase/invertase (TIGR01784 family)
MSREKYELDTQSNRVHAERVGERRGKRAGRLEGKLEIARKLKSMGMLIDQIAEGTGLSINDIARL